MCSPSIHLDETWNPVKKYITERTGLEPFYDEFGEESLTHFVKHNEKVVAQQKSVGTHNLLGVPILLDDLAAIAVMRNPHGTIAHLAVMGQACLCKPHSVQSNVQSHPPSDPNAAKPPIDLASMSAKGIPIASR